MLQLFLKKNKNCIINFYFIIYNNKYTYIKLKTETVLKKLVSIAKKLISNIKKYFFIIINPMDLFLIKNNDFDPKIPKTYFLSRSTRFDSY
jgi:hypothetical protein